MFAFKQSFFLMLLTSVPPDAFARKTTRTRGLSGKKVKDLDDLKDLLFSGDCISLEVGKKGGVSPVRALNKQNEGEMVAHDNNKEHRDLGDCGGPPIFDMCTNPDQLGGEVVELVGPGIMSAYCCDANINMEALATSEGCSGAGDVDRKLATTEQGERKLSPPSPGISVGSPPQVTCEFPQTCSQDGDPCETSDDCCPGQGLGCAPSMQCGFL